MQYMSTALHDQLRIMRDNDRALHFVTHALEKRAKALHASTVKAACGFIVE